MRVAFGKINITPKDYLGKPMAGYTPAPKIVGKLDDIHAYAVLMEDLVLGNIKKRILLISLDYLKISLLFSNYVKERIEDAYKIHPNQVLIHAIHTHKSLDITGEFVFGGGFLNVLRGIMFGAYYGDDKYKVWVAMQIEKLVGQLIEELQPAKIAWTKKTIEDDIIINRRHPSRRSKSALGVISFKNSETGKIIGIISSYGMHPTTLNNTVNKMSADYPGRVNHRIEEQSNGEISSAFFTAPAGDLNPITTCGTDFEYLETHRNPVYDQTGNYKHTQKLGYFLGDKTLELAKNIPDEDYYEHIEFKSYVKIFWVPEKDYKKFWSNQWIRNRFVHFMKKYFLFPVAITLGDSMEPNFPGFGIKHRGLDINIYTEIQYIKFKATSNGKSKEFAITGVPGELFEDIAKTIYDKTPTGFEDTFIFQNANDWIAYLFPLKEYITVGGYEPLASYGPLCGAYVQNYYFRLLKEIEDDITGGYN